MIRHISILVIVVMAAIGLFSKEPSKRFRSASDCVFYYDKATSCQEIHNSELSFEEINRLSGQSRERILSSVKNQYSDTDYKAVHAFFLMHLIKWNKKYNVTLYPCYADKVIVNKKEAWVISFAWEIPIMADKAHRIMLGHIMVFVIDPKTGEILDTASCG